MDITYTPAELGNAVLIVGAALLAALAAFVLVCNAVEKITSIRRARRVPDDEQEKRLAELEAWRRDVDGKLNNDNDRLESLDEGSRVTQRALLALLDHGIDGNNIDQMRHAKEELQNHLINR
jgi:hypothetical protein